MAAGSFSVFVFNPFFFLFFFINVVSIFFFPVSAAERSQANKIRHITLREGCRGEACGRGVYLDY